VLRAFLASFGVDVTLPGIGNANLFLGGRLDVAEAISKDDQIPGYVLHIVDGQCAETFAMITNVWLDPIEHSVRIELLAFYCTDRYEKAVGSRRRRQPTITVSEGPLAKEKRLARAEYKKQLMASGYQPRCIDTDWSNDFAAECKKAGVPVPVHKPGDVVSYQGILDIVAGSVEELIRERGHKLKYGVFVGEWPLGEFQASVTRRMSRRRAIVFVNVGLMALVYQMAKIITYSLESVFTNDPQKSIVRNLGWKPLGWTPKDAVGWIAETLAAYVIHGDCRGGERLPLADVGRAFFAMTLTKCAEIFVVAHEYAHLLLEHGHGPHITFATPYGDIEAIGQNQQDEYDADLAAADLCLATANWSGDDPAGLLDVNFRVAGPCLLFLVAVFLDGMRRGPHDFTINIAGNHPTPFCRMTKILDHFSRRYGGSANMLGELIRQLIFELIVPSVEKAQTLISEHRSR
jgi:hypothetical protein